MKQFIYTLADPVSKEIKYIGKTKDIKDRLYRHSSSYSLKDSWTSKNKWILWLKNQGMKPLMEILDEGNEENINELEIYWISQFKTWGYKLKNETEGGDGGRNWLGKKHKESSKELMKMNHPMRKSICQYEIGTDKLIKEFDSSHEIERETSYYRGHVVKCCKGVKNYNGVGEYYWRFKDNYFPYDAPSNKSLKIEQYDENWNLIKIYKSTHELRKSGFNYRVIEKSITNKYKGYYWKIIR